MPVMIAVFKRKDESGERDKKRKNSRDINGNFRHRRLQSYKKRGVRHVCRCARAFVEED